VRIAVAGKGGAGKSVIAGTVARILAQRGHRVLALDVDPMPGLAVSIGVGLGTGAWLDDVSVQDEDGSWRLRKGVGAVRAVREFSELGPDGVRLLRYGNLAPGGLGRVRGAFRPFWNTAHQLADARALRDWVIVSDLSAGARQVAMNWTPFANITLAVFEPRWQSALAARRIVRIARSRPGMTALPIVNRVGSEWDPQRCDELIGEPAFASLPYDESLAEADRLGVALIDHAPESAAVIAIRHLVDMLEAVEERAESA